MSHIYDFATRDVSPRFNEGSNETPEPVKKPLRELLEKQRTIFISEPVSPELTAEIVPQLLWLDSQNDQPIRLFINTPGGSADDGFAIHDAIRFVRSPVNCISFGLNASAGTIILLASPKERRFALPNCRIMIHQPSGGARGKALGDRNLGAADLAPPSSCQRAHRQRNGQERRASREGHQQRLLVVPRRGSRVRHDQQDLDQPQRPVRDLPEGGVMVNSDSADIVGDPTSPFERAFAYRRGTTTPPDSVSAAASTSTGTSPQPLPPLRLGFLLSGSGRTLQNLVEVMPPEVARVCCVVSDRKKAFGLERAKNLGIPAFVLPCRNTDDSAAIFRKLAEHNVELVILGGFLRLLTVPREWEQRVLNIHPSLIPKYCGEGFYGDRVHEAVLAGGETESGCTVHFVDNIYDNGPPLLQERVAVEPDDTVDTLADRVFDAECVAYPKAIRLIAEGRVVWASTGPCHSRVALPSPQSAPPPASKLDGRVATLP